MDARDLAIDEGQFEILESGAVVATRGVAVVAVELTTIEMRQFASKLQRAASFIDAQRRAATIEARNG